MSVCLRTSCGFRVHRRGEHASAVREHLRELDGELLAVDREIERLTEERNILENVRRRASTALVVELSKSGAQSSNGHRKLTAREAAEIARVSPRWFYAHAARYSWIGRTSNARGARILVDEAGLRRHLERVR